jgi:predicted Zn-dependent peptidase
MGNRNDRRLPFALRYLQYLGTDKYTADQLARKFFDLGCEFSVNAGDDQSYIALSGLQESFVPAVKLFEEMLDNVRPDKGALAGMIDQELKMRADAKLDKETILWRGMLEYAEYGPKNPFTDRLSEKELRALSAEDLTTMLHTITDFRHKVLYYGPGGKDELTAELNADHRMPATPVAPPPETVYTRSDIKENVVYFVDFNMVQAEIVWLGRSAQFDPATVPVASLFNEYYGGSMASVVFQNLRESKALAYSTFARYDIPQRKSDPFYIVGYIGTQADKLNEALPAMNSILNDMPRTERAFTAAKEGLRNQMETGRVTRADILFDYLAAQKQGLDHDIRSDIYGKLDRETLDDLQRFHDQYYKDKPYAYCVLGSKKRIDMKELGKYGRVVTLSLKDIFGY